MAWQGPYDNSYSNPNTQSPMNDFKDQTLEDDAFGPSAGNIVSAFDAFRTQGHSQLPSVKSQAVRPLTMTFTIADITN